MINLTDFMQIFNIIKTIPMFSKLNWFDIQRISRKSELAQYSKGDLICTEGSDPDFFYCLISGRLQAYVYDSEGQKSGVEFIHRGAAFGLISSLTGANHSMNFEAINDSVVLKISRQNFDNLFKAIPQMGMEFSHNLSKKVRRRNGSAKSFESKIISVYSPVKGTGTSTYALNLAINLQKETKKKIIFVGMSSLDGEGKSPWKTEGTRLSDLVSHSEKVFDHIVQDELNVDMLHVVFDPKKLLAEKNIAPLLSALVGKYHYVVMDLPHTMDPILLKMLTQSDLVHLLTFDQKKDLTCVKNVIDNLEKQLKENFREEKIKVIIRSLHHKIYLSFEEIDKFIDYSVYTMLPPMEESEREKEESSQYISFMKPLSHSEYAKVVKRNARAIGGVLVGVVLGGGAALGLAHIGVIRELEKNNIPVDIVVGSSMGALIGSMWCIGMDANKLETVAKEFEKPLNMLKLFDPVFPISGFVGGRFIKRWLKKYLGNRTFYSTKIPFKVVSYDLNKRRERVLNTGSLVDAVRESIAIPGVITPVIKNDQIIIDGGVLNPLPTNVLVNLGIKKIIAVNVLQSPEEVAHGVEMAQKKMSKKSCVHRWFMKVFTPQISSIIVKTLQASEYVIAEQSAKQAHVNIHPDLTGIEWYELNRVDELVQAGQIATQKNMSALKNLIDDA